MSELKKKLRAYGRVQLDTDELAALELPWMFAISDIYKCFTKLIWKTHFNHNPIPDIHDVSDNKRSIHYFYDKCDMTLNMKGVYSNNLSFNKREGMLPHVDAAL